MTTSPLAQPHDTVQVDLTGRTALVTGAGSGIGRATALRLARSGAHVIAVDLKEEAVREVAEITGGDAVVADLSDLDALDALNLSADILVNCAGIQHVRPIEDFDPEKFSQILRIMLEAPFRLIRRSLPSMYEKGWGRIINVSSVHGLRASEFKSAYVSAKHGLEGLSKVVALEGAAHGVTSNCVNPGYVRTPLVDKQVADQAAAHGISENEVLEKVFLDKAALKRLVESEEIAEMVLFLCSPPAASMTGTSLVVDGGWSAH
ncbi:3-hydroxybutyrate dehydrogenase [Oryzihumus leptocrescens]|uniref:3-hydroxybutyrate dehydrogenase n=3 Tax=Oryzihumus leptocrescens TaxID=297536 RepID=A0A542Z922_9MICO|nr:3-hydroxybutyrate dehydrogenase [Oryzihumus leptocrescens]TQL56844.1 3-hydroxybutyrate dehydrogenase [Oryzihumus leptocrescens]